MRSHYAYIWEATQIGGGLLLLGIAILPPVLLPVPRTPKPTGPYAIGTTSFMLVDESREEIYAEKAGEPRTIMVQIWYPAETVRGAELAPWLGNMDVMGPAIAGHLDLPAFFLDHVKYAQTNAVTNAPIAIDSARAASSLSPSSATATVTPIVSKPRTFRQTKSMSAR